jgi:hypothetical protein
MKSLPALILDENYTKTIKFACTCLTIILWIGILNNIYSIILIL